MSSNFQDDFKEINQETCPHLGLKNDQVTFSSYPSGWNACHHVNPVSTPTLDFQRRFCLRANYVNCPIYQSASGQKMPRDIQLRESGISGKTKQILLLALLAVVGIVIILGFVFKDQILAIINPEQEMTPQPTDYVSVIQKTPTELPLTQTPTNHPPTPTLIPPTPTTEPVILELETPIGAPDLQFLIHRVSQGESLEVFADVYNTSVDAIIAVNSSILIPLWIDSLIVIPVNTLDVVSLPAFEPYQVEIMGLTPQTLAEKLSVDPDDLSRYNNVPSEYLFNAGDWILVPREKSQP